MKSDTVDAAHFLGKKMQLAFVVRDMDEAMRYWTEVMQVGPFVVFESCRDNRRLTYRGADTGVEWSLGFAYWQDVQLELICQTNDEPSAFKELLDSGREGLQHIGFWPDDFEGACAYLEDKAHKEVTVIYLDDGRRNGIYYESPRHIGPMIELVPWTTQRAAYFDRIRRLSDTWDGVSRPVRKFANRAAFLESGEGA